MKRLLLISKRWLSVRGATLHMVTMSLMLMVAWNSSGQRFVKQGGTGDGWSWDTAAGNLQATIDACPAGQQVWVAAGTYQQPSGQSFSMKSGVKIYGGFPATGNPAMENRNPSQNVTILQGNNNRVIYNLNVDTAAWLDGFTIQGGTLTSGHGAGIYNMTCHGKFINCIIRNNTTTEWGGGAYSHSSYAKFINCLFYGNNASGGGAIFLHNTEVGHFNCTVTANHSNVNGGGIHTHESGSSSFYSSILWANNAIGNGDEVYTTGSSSINGLFSSASNEEGDIYGDFWAYAYGDPMFTDPANNNYVPTSDSPAVNYGNITYEHQYIPTDLAGNPRTYGPAIDRGAYEVQTAPTTIRYVKQGGTGNGTSWANASGDLQAMITASSAGDKVWVAAGTYQPAVNQSFSMKDGVKIYGGFANSGTPTLAQRNWVTNVTTLQGNNTRVVNNTNNGLTTSSILDGFTITNGTAGQGGGIAGSNVSPTLSNLVVKNNYASSEGGGIYFFGGSPVLTGVSIIQNTVGSTGNNVRRGGGLYTFDASPVLINVLVANNSIIGTGGLGGGLSFAKGSPSLLNVTVAGNTAATGSGVYTQEGALQVRNSIVWNNSFSMTSGTTALYNSIVQGSGGSTAWNSGYGTDNGGNMDLDPLFVNSASGDYSLLACSPAANSGNNSFMPSDVTKDLSGNTRIFGAIIDRGAYEFQGTAVTAPVASAQTFCGSQTVANLVATGTSLKWYSVASGGTALLSTAAIATGTYYVSQTASGCESARTAVSVTLTNQPAPTASTQNFCGSATVANLTATGTAIKWYTVATGGTALASIASLSTATYYVSQTLNGCESPRTAVTVTVNAVPAAPTGTALILPASATVANLTATGQGLKWYNVATGGTQLNTATTVTAGTYYVSQTVNGCESARTAVAVTIFSSATVYVRKGFTGDGSSWGNAMGELANALQLAKTANASLAGSIIQIWVGAGTYKPLLRADNYSSSNPSDRDNAFVLLNNVKVYGGFAGTETVLADRNIELTANASILSGDFSENDIFDASGHVSSNNTENAYHVVISTGAVGTAQLDGFTISGAFANASGATLNVGGTTVSKGAGGGMTVYNSSPQISNMVFEKNSSSSVGVALLLSNSASVINTTIFRFNKGGLGAGIHCQTGSTPTITNCLFSDNFVNGFGSGGGISVAGGSNATINKSIFKNNKAGSGAGVYSTSATVSLKDCLFFGNISLAANGAGGGLLTLNSTGNVLNTTFAANEAINGAGIFYSGGNVAVHNSIIWGNTATSASGYAIEGSGGSMVFKNTLVQGTNSSGTSWPSFYGTNSGGNIAGQDPLFTNAAIGDYTLNAASPARNSGDTTLYTNALSSTDLAGNPRVNSALQNIDMGAYESQLTVYAPSITGVLYVKKGVTGGTGSSWSSPIAELSDALKTANDLNAITPGSISQIWVSGGTYKPMYRASDLDGSNPTDLMNSFKLVNDVDVYGGFAGTETSLANRDLSLSANASILNGDFNGDDAYDMAGLLSGNYGDNAMHVVIGAQITAETFFDGFTIQGGNTGGGGFIMEGVYIENTFGSAINTRNCLVNLQNLIVKKNRSEHANGAIGNLFGPANIANSLIIMNSGGAIENNSGTITITNCTIAMNASSGTGAGLTSSGSFAVRNSILWNNAGTSPYFQSTNVSAGGSGSFQNSIIETAFTSFGTWTIAGTNSGGNSDLNPLFTNANSGDFTLNVVSPARNMANATFLSSTITKDLAGNARTYGSAMDIGAYENQQSGASPSQSGIIYVVKGQSGEGSSWASPLGELADALKVAKLMPEGAVKQIWVAGGIYKPMYRPDNLESANSADRHNTFLMVPRLKIFGGFAGTETTLEQRDLAQEGNKSILSGDLSSNDTFGTYGQLEGNYSDNAYHVVLGSNLIWFSTVPTGAQINGFTVTGGNADGNEVVTANGIANISSQYGGGMYILNCTNSPALVNMVFKGNRAAYGGAIASTTSATMNNILFTGNIATIGGSAIYSKGSSMTINNCTVSKNFTQFGFSGVYMDATTPGFITVRNSILSDNPYTAPASAGSFTTALRHYNTNLDTASSVSGAWQAAYGMNMGGNTAAQPLFMNPEAGDFKLQPGSSNINGGSNTLYTTGLSTTDLVGKARFYNTTIDRGAYEFDGVICTGVSSPATQYVSDNTVNISWQGIGDESSFEYAITTNIIPPTSGTPTSDEFATNVTVTPNATNYLHIKNNCKWIRYNFYQGYCTPAPSTVNNQGIVKVAIGAMVNTSVAETGNYGNYTAQTVSIPAGYNQPATITFATGQLYYHKMWVDWNGDRDFNDAGETIYSGTVTSGNQIASYSLNVPEGTPAGNYRIRIGGIAGPSIDALTPCYTGVLGTFEDYTLIVTPCTQWTGVVDSNWDNAANWCDGIVPTINTDVTIYDVENDPVVNGQAYLRNLFLSNQATLIVDTESTLTASRSLQIAGNATLFVENTGSLVQHEDVENSGEITFLKHSNPLYKLDYTIWSSPVSGQNLQDFSPETLPNRFYTFGIGADGDEAYLPAPASGNFEEGKGYLIRMPDQRPEPETSGYNTGLSSHVHEGTFTGVPHNGTLEMPMSVQDNFTSMVGNPYASPINVSEFFAQNATVLSPVHGLYFWRKRNNADATSYATLNTIAYTANDGGTLAGANGVFDDVNNYGGQQWENYFGLTASADWTIAAAQGFFVVGNGSGGNLKFTNMMRTSSNSGQPFFRMNPPVPAPVSRLWLNLNNETNFSQIAVAYTDNATLGMDFGMDSKQFSGGKISVYSLAEGEKLGIQGRPAFEDTDIVPLGYKVLNAGSYSISLHRKDGLFNEGQPVYLRDNLLGTTYDFAGGHYQFTTEGGTFDNRFEVVYNNEALSVNQPDTDANSIVVYKKDTDLHISSGKLQMGSVRIFDIRGRIVYERDEINAPDIIISDLHIEQEVIIVQVTTDEGVVVSKKVVF